ncbi:MAG: putative sulfate/molybdate transporter [Candidatus Rokuibacteriota bacterium]
MAPERAGVRPSGAAVARLGDARGDARGEGPVRLGGNEYTLRELGGAFGDLGTLAPFLAGYIAVSGLDPAAILVPLGAFQILAGLYYRTPMPVQPMKAIGTAAISDAAIAPGAIWASGLFTGALWLGLGLSGVITWLARLTSRAVVGGLVLGLGLGLMLQGVAMMRGEVVLAVLAAALTLALLTRPRVPAMLVLLALGAAVAIARDPALTGRLAQLSWTLRLPMPVLDRLGWDDAVVGVLVLGLPQAALTLGNAVLATTHEHNALFPQRPVSVRAIAMSHGLMNVAGGAVGGIPLCHGAGGIAGHVRFGARTGGALVMMGTLVLVVGLFLADSVGTLLQLVPPAVLGTVLVFAGLELAVGAAGAWPVAARERYVLIATAGIALWNMGAAYAVGLALAWASATGWLGTEEAR